MTINNLPEDAKCPLPGCGAQLYLNVTTSFAVYDTVTPVSDLRQGASICDGWEVECENSHRLDMGCTETDGRSTILGLRSALSLGGLR